MTELLPDDGLPISGYRRNGIECFIDISVPIGLGVKVWHYAVVLAGVDLGIGCSIGAHCEIGFNAVIGAHTRISKGVFIPSRAVIGSRVFIGPNVTFTDDRYPRAGNAEYTAEPPVIEDGASIGAGAVILPGVRIGKNARVGAGAVVTRDVPAEALVRGEPARIRALAGVG